MLSLLLLACNTKTGDTAAIEPLSLPDDPAAAGAPVGVQTLTHGGVTFEVWYPAADAAAGQETEAVDLDQFLPASFTEHIGASDIFPAPDSGAVRDAAPRETGAPLPVILFSHGFGGFRLQSFSLTVHLASRGYVVVAPDHPGRMLGDALPCVFSPPLEGCDLTGFLEDPALEDLPEVLDWLDAQSVLPALDTAQVGMMGHSAGASSATSYTDAQPRIAATLTMSGTQAMGADVPALFFGGECDAVTPASGTAAAARTTPGARYAEVLGAGHQTFSDICTADLGALAAKHLDGRDDLSGSYESLLSLGLDGCPGVTPAVQGAGCADGFVDISVATEAVRGLSTQFFDRHLRGAGDLDASAYDVIVLGD